MITIEATHIGYIMLSKDLLLTTLNDRCKASGERNDCAVKALAILSDITYEDARLSRHTHGRNQVKVQVF